MALEWRRSRDLSIFSWSWTFRILYLTQKPQNDGIAKSECQLVSVTFRQSNGTNIAQDSEWPTMGESAGVTQMRSSQ